MSSTQAPSPHARARGGRVHRLGLGAALGAVIALSSTGCLYSRYASDTRRSATEQLLISGSIDRVVAGLVLPDVRGRSVVVEARSVDTVDMAYLQAALEARLGAAGARIAPAPEAELIVTVLVGAIGTVSRKASFGLPSIPIPTAGATPEIPIVSLLRQRGWARARAVVRTREGVHVAPSADVMARARFDVTSVVFIELRSNDIYPGEEGALAIE
jgi:hypothetical protein